MKKLLIVTALLLFIGFVFGQQPEKGHLVDYTQVWRMSINLKTRHLVPPAVQWTVYDKDPVPSFRTRVRRRKDFHTEQLNRAKNRTDKEIARSSMMTVCWDLGFEEVTGDKVYLLTRARGVSHSLMSNDPDGEKWIVTKIVQIKGKPVCWCIPVTVETGKEMSIVLTDDNMFDLESAFDNAMRSSGY
jgi:hypothetical protein